MISKVKRMIHYQKYLRDLDIFSIFSQDQEFDKEK